MKKEQRGKVIRKKKDKTGVKKRTIKNRLSCGATTLRVRTITII
jgi:hypothetical protein